MKCDLKASIIDSWECTVTDSKLASAQQERHGNPGSLKNRDSGALGTISPTLSSSHACPCHIIGVVTAMVPLEQELRL